MTDQDHTNDIVLQSGRAVIYTRVPPGAQTTMPQPQETTLIAFANAQGYPNERITVYVEVGVSARRPLARHSVLQDLLAAIMLGEQTPEQERIRTVYVLSEGRLFRDASTVDLAAFIRVCQEHGVTLATPTHEYDFTNPAYVALFRSQCLNASQLAEEAIRMIHQMRAGQKRRGRKQD